MNRDPGSRGALVRFQNPGGSPLYSGTFPLWMLMLPSRGTPKVDRFRMRVPTTTPRSASSARSRAAASGPFRFPARMSGMFCRAAKSSRDHGSSGNARRSSASISDAGMNRPARSSSASASAPVTLETAYANPSRRTFRRRFRNRCASAGRWVSRRMPTICTEGSAAILAMHRRFASASLPVRMATRIGPSRRDCRRRSGGRGARRHSCAIPPCVRWSAVAPHVRRDAPSPRTAPGWPAGC